VHDGHVSHHKPARSDKHDAPLGPGSKVRGDTQRVRRVEGGPRTRRGGQIIGGAGAAARARAGALGTDTREPEAESPKEEAGAGPAEGSAMAGEGRDAGKPMTGREDRRADQKTQATRGG
jgi:hypothetical protein